MSWQETIYHKAGIIKLKASHVDGAETFNVSITLRPGYLWLEGRNEYPGAWSDHQRRKGGGITRRYTDRKKGVDEAVEVLNKILAKYRSSASWEPR